MEKKGMTAKQVGEVAERKFVALFVVVCRCLS